jgi:hypothetical protein
MKIKENLNHFWSNYVVPAYISAKATAVWCVASAKEQFPIYKQWAIDTIRDTGKWVIDTIHSTVNGVHDWCKGFFEKENLKDKLTEAGDRSLLTFLVCVWIGIDAVSGTRPKKFRYPNPWVGFKWIGPSDLEPKPGEYDFGFYCDHCGCHSEKK